MTITVDWDLKQQIKPTPHPPPPPKNRSHTHSQKLYIRCERNSEIHQPAHATVRENHKNTFKTTSQTQNNKTAA